jgi:prepilin-type N-terminal cleavage/methylation domain-containing protein
MQPTAMRAFLLPYTEIPLQANTTKLLRGGRARHCQGFSLIELMVVIAIALALILVGAPLTGSWINQAKVRQTVVGLQEGMGHLRAHALKNTQAVGAASGAAVFISSAASMCVFNSASLACANCNASSHLVWQFTPSASVALNSSDSTALGQTQCIVYTPLGLPASGIAVAGTVCGNTLQYLVSQGTGSASASASGTLN